MFNIDKDKLIYYLKNLISIGSPSGYTHKVMNYIQDELSKLQIPYKTTNKGALIVSFEGQNKDYERTFSAHVDTLGAIVKNINSKGTLSFLPIGGFMMTCI
ncbi:hydrolase, peptidase M42 family [Clostridium sp. N3C]|nr:hydrolase, peptidase M42 family [Clostridium sp. N3C]